MARLPFLVVHGVEIWCGLAALSAVTVLGLAYFWARRRVRRAWRERARELSTPTPPANWSPDDEITLAGILESGGDVETEIGPEGGAEPPARWVRTDDVSVELRGQLHLAAGARASSMKAGAKQRLGVGDPVRVRGRLEAVAGDSAVDYRSGAAAWALVAPDEHGLIAVSARPTRLPRPSLRWAALWLAISLAGFAGLSTLVSYRAYRAVKERGSPLSSLYTRSGDHQVTLSARLASVSPFFWRKTLRSIGFAYAKRIFHYGGRRALEWAVTAYQLVGDGEEAARIALQHGRPDIALAVAGREEGPGARLLGATALYYLGRFSEASDVFAAGAGREAPKRAAETHLRAGNFTRAAESLSRYAEELEDSEGGGHPEAARRLATTLRARAGDEEARRRLARLAAGGDWLAGLLSLDGNPSATVELGDGSPRHLDWRAAALAPAIQFERGNLRPGDHPRLVFHCPLGDLEVFFHGDWELRRTGYLFWPGLAERVVVRAEEREKLSEKERQFVTCVAHELVHYYAAAERLDQARRWFERWEELAPQKADEHRAQRIRAGLAYREGRIEEASRLLEELRTVDQEYLLPLAVVEAIELGDPSEFEGDGTELLSLMAEELDVPPYVYAVAPYIERGREEVISLAFHPRLSSGSDPLQLASSRLQLARALRAPKIAEHWEGVRDRFLSSETPRDVSVVLYLLRAWI